MKNIYTVNDLAKIFSVSKRTLHFYDKIGLLKPKTYNHSGYRLYEDEQINRLKEIVFYRDLEIDLATIKKLLENPKIDKIEILDNQRTKLITEGKRIDGLINKIENYIQIFKNS